MIRTNTPPAANTDGVIWTAPSGDDGVIWTAPSGLSWT